MLDFYSRQPLAKKYFADFALFWLIASLIPAITHAAANSEPSQQEIQSVFTAALKGNIDPVREALENGFPPNASGPVGRTVLMMAAYNGHKSIVAELIEAGADVNATDKQGSSALMFASSGPFVKTVELLLDNGADVNAVDKNEHFSALMWAAAEGQTKVVELLLKHGADITLKDIDGDTALTFAAQANHQKIVSILKKAQAKANEGS